MLTLYTTPVIYLYMDRLGRYLSRRKRGAAGAASTGEPAPEAT
ncbi:MAG TPA: hypothetical protein VGC79_36945 [Polyangiaceae bacterium]